MMPYKKTYEEMAQEASWAHKAFMVAFEASEQHDPFFKALRASTDKTLTIELTVNGFSLPFEAVVNSMVAEYEANLRAAASELIRERAAAVLKSAEELTGMMDLFGSRIAEELYVRKP